MDSRISASRRRWSSRPGGSQTRADKGGQAVPELPAPAMPSAVPLFGRIPTRPAAGDGEGCAGDAEEQARGPAPLHSCECRSADGGQGAEHTTTWPMAPAISARAIDQHAHDEAQHRSRQGNRGGHHQAPLGHG